LVKRARRQPACGGESSAALAGQLGGLAAALHSGIARETSERPSVSPPGPRPAFLPHGTPGMQEPPGFRP
jgi:hypothetical protein